MNQLLKVTSSHCGDLNDVTKSLVKKTPSLSYRKNKPKKSSQTIARIPDIGPSERHARGEMARDHRVSFIRARVRCECRIDWYRLHGFIDARQAAAGLRYRSLCSVATLSSRLVSVYGERIRGAPFELVDARIQAAKDLRCLHSIMGEKERRAVERVAGLDDYVGRGGVEDLRRGLDCLADHWQLVP